MRLSTGWWVVFVSLFAFACGGGQPASTPNVAPVVTPLPDDNELELDDEPDDEDGAPPTDAGAGDEADDDEGDEDDA
ncbi:MAG: hypothetical protein KIT72_09575 [Polyangiaceae bacterium]|nr:hypothetical protein [Polyangiaceae bacterium]MCW5790657.1 hypothetical protein [Polyangiaceae bacterium]